MISPYAKQNYVDHTVTDQSSILRFIEDNWLGGQRINGSFDSLAGTLNNMFDFKNPPRRDAIPTRPNTRENQWDIGKVSSDIGVSCKSKVQEQTVSVPCFIYLHWSPVLHPITRRGLLKNTAFLATGLAIGRNAFPASLNVTPAAPVPLTLDTDTLAHYVDQLPILPIARPTGFRSSPADPALQLPFYRMAMCASRHQAASRSCSNANVGLRLELAGTNF